MRYRSGELLLDTERRTIMLGDRIVDADTRSFDLIACVMAAWPEVVDKEHLVDIVWSRPITDNAIWLAVHKARRLLGDDADAPRWLRTVHARGLAWMQPVVRSDDPKPAALDAPTAATPKPEAPAPPAAAATVAPAPLPATTSASTQIAARPSAPRWGLGLGVLVAALAIAFVGWRVLAPAPEHAARVATPDTVVPATPPRPVRVAPLDILMADMEWARHGLMALMQETLSRDGFDVIDAASSAPLGEHDWPQSVEVSAALTRVGSLYVLKLEARGRDGAVLRDQFAGTAPSALAIDAAEAVARWLRPQRKTGPADIDPFAAEAFALGMDALVRGDGAVARSHFEVAMVRAPEFVAAAAKRAQALVLTAQYDAARGQALAIDRDGVAPILRHEARLVLAEVARRQGRLDEAASLYAAVLDDASNDPALERMRGRAHAGLGIVLAERGQSADAERAFEAASTIARARGDPVEELHALNGLATVAARDGRLRTAEARYQVVLDLARSFDLARLEATALRNLAATASARGRYENAAALLSLALTAAQSVADPEGEIICLSNIASVLIEVGRHDDASRALRVARTLAGSRGAATVMADLDATAAENALRAGDYVAARRWSAQALAAYREQGRSRLALREAERAVAIDVAAHADTAASAAACREAAALVGADCATLRPPRTIEAIRAALAAAERRGDERAMAAEQRALAEHLLEASDWDGASAALTTALNERPDHPALLRLAQRLARDTGDTAALQAASSRLAALREAAPISALTEHVMRLQIADSPVIKE